MMKRKYVLHTISQGIHVYILKEKTKTPIDTPWLCTNCFDVHNKESIMINTSPGNTMRFKFECPNCSNFIIIDNPNFKDNFKDIDLNSGDNFYSNIK